MDKRKVKGNFVKGHYDFVVTNYAPAERDKIIASMDPATVALIPKISMAEWYPLDHVVSILDAIVANRPSDKVEEEVKYLGYSIANEALGTFLKLILKILTPKLFASKFDSFWRKYHDFGELRADLTKIDSNRILLILAEGGYPWVHNSAAGWAEAAFRAMGIPQAVVTWNVPHGQRELPGSQVIWDVRW